MSDETPKKPKFQPSDPLSVRMRKRREESAQKLRDAAPGLRALQQDTPTHRLTPGDYLAAGFDPPEWDERPWTDAVLKHHEEIEAKVQTWRQSVTDDEREAQIVFAATAHRDAMTKRLKEIEDIADVPLPADESWNLLAEAMEIEDLLEKVPEQKH